MPTTETDIESDLIDALRSENAALRQIVMHQQRIAENLLWALNGRPDLSECNPSSTVEATPGQ